MQDEYRRVRQRLEPSSPWDLTDFVDGYGRANPVANALFHRPGAAPFDAATLATSIAAENQADRRMMTLFTEFLLRLEEHLSVLIASPIERLDRDPAEHAFVMRVMELINNLSAVLGDIRRGWDLPEEPRDAEEDEVRCLIAAIHVCAYIHLAYRRSPFYLNTRLRGQRAHGLRIASNENRGHQRFGNMYSRAYALQVIRNVLFNYEFDDFNGNMRGDYTRSMLRLHAFLGAHGWFDDPAIAPAIEYLRRNLEFPPDEYPESERRPPDLADADSSSSDEEDDN